MANEPRTRRALCSHGPHSPRCLLGFLVELDGEGHRARRPTSQARGARCGRRAWRARSRRSRQGEAEFAEPRLCVGDHCAEVSDSGTKVKCVPKGTELGAGGGWFPRPTEENERQVQKGGLHVRGLPEGGSPNSLTSMAPQDTPLGIKIILRNGGYRRSSKN